MAYITNTLTDANAPATLYTALATALTTAGYTLVDTVVISTRTHKIWRNPAANNPIGKDWYLDVAYTTTGGGSLWLAVFEFYDPATDLGYRGVYNITSGTGFVPEATYYSRWGASGFALESTTNWTTAPGTTNATQILCPATSFGYWISVTGSRLAMMSSQEPTVVAYAGCFTPSASHAAAAGADAFPLMQGRFAGAGASGNTVGVTRYPKLLTTTANQGHHLDPVNPLASVSSGASPKLPGSPRTLFAYFDIVPYALGIYPSTVSAHPAEGIMGYLIDVGATTVESTVTRGDTGTDNNGAQWVFTSQSTQSQAALIKAV